MRTLRRVIIWLLVLELIAAFAIATAIRLKLEQPARYIGSTLPASPQLLADPRAPVLDAGQHEEQIAEAIQVVHDGRLQGSLAV
jgi:hypothetical protein